MIPQIPTFVLPLAIGGLASTLPAVAVTLSGVVTMIAIGFYLRRKCVIDDGSDATLLKLLVRVFIPALIVSRVLGNEALRDVRNVLWPPIIAFGLVTGGIALALLVARLLPNLIPPGKTRRTFGLTTGMFNYGYITIPLVDALFPDNGTSGVLFVFNLGVEAAMWGVGLTVLAGGMTRGWWKRLLSPPVVATVLALIVNAINNRLGLYEASPQAVLYALEAADLALTWLAAAAIPLGLLLTGSTICDDWGAARLRRGIGVIATSATLRLAVLPVAFIGLALALPITRQLQTVLVLQAAMPAAVFPIVLSRHYGGDVGTALRVVVGTSLLALVTMPIWITVGLFLIR